jgi:hypothetical protein
MFTKCSLPFLFLFDILLSSCHSPSTYFVYFHATVRVHWFRLLVFKEEYCTEGLTSYPLIVDYQLDPIFFIPT